MAEIKKDTKKGIAIVAVAGAATVATVVLLSKKAKAGPPEEGREPIDIIWQ